MSSGEAVAGGIYRPPISPARADASVIAALTAVVADHGRWGFWKCFDRLRLQGHPWNHKRVHRVYCALRLNLPRRTKRRVPHRLRQPLAAPPRLNHTWALDFMADVLYDRRHFRVLTIIDEGNREALAVEAWTSIPASRVIRVLEALVALHGRPAAIRVDNGPELLAQVFVDWCSDRGIAEHYCAGADCAAMTIATNKIVRRTDRRVTTLINERSIGEQRLERKCDAILR